MSENKKKIERFYFDSFLSLLGIEPSKIQERESPDFVAMWQGKRLGVELTHFHSDLKGVGGKTRRAIEETWISLQKTIMDKVEHCRRLKGTYGILFFKHLEVPPKRLHETFSEELIQLSLNMLKANREKSRPDAESPLLNKYLKEFILKRPGLYITWNWNHDVSSVGVTEKELIDIIMPKVNEVLNYKREPFHELWLIVVSGYRLSQAMGILLGNRLDGYTNLNNLLQQSGYDKVYIYQYMFDLIYEWPGWTQKTKR